MLFVSFWSEEYRIDDETHVCDPCHLDDGDGADISRYSVSERSTTLKTRFCNDPDILYQNILKY